MKQRRFDLVLSSVKHAFHQGHAVLRNNFQFPITHISLTRALRRHGGSSSIHRYKAVAGENHLMDNNSVFNGYGNYNRTFSSYSSASQRDVRYSCGACGYELNLSSSNRNTTSIGSKYGKSIKRGIISFFNIDDSRFTQVDEIQCAPHFHKHSWGLFRRRTKLLCRKCGNHIGNAYNGFTSSFPLVTDGEESSPSSKVSSGVKYDIRIRSLQPSSSDESGIPVLA